MVELSRPTDIWVGAIEADGTKTSIAESDGTKTGSIEIIEF